MEKSEIETIYRKYFTCGYMVSSPLSRSENAIRKVQGGQE